MKGGLRRGPLAKGSQCPKDRCLSEVLSGCFRGCGRLRILQLDTCEVKWPYSSKFQHIYFGKCSLLHKEWFWIVASIGICQFTSEWAQNPRGHEEGRSTDGGWPLSVHVPQEKGNAGGRANRNPRPHSFLQSFTQATAIQAQPAELTREAGTNSQGKERALACS